MCDTEKKPESKGKPKRKILLPRFGLRTMMIVVAVLCVLLGWKVNQAEKQRKAVAEIRKWKINPFEGTSVYYDFQMEIHDDPFKNSLSDLPLPAPEWLIDLVGIDYFSGVSAVVASDVELSDILSLADLKFLHSVDLSNTKVSDLTPLHNLKKLTYLNLSNTPVSEEEIKMLQKELPNCQITR